MRIIIACVILLASYINEESNKLVPVPQVPPRFLAEEMFRFEETTCRLSNTIPELQNLGGSDACKRIYQQLHDAYSNCDEVCSMDKTNPYYEILQRALDAVSVWFSLAIAEFGRNAI